MKCSLSACEDNYVSTILHKSNMCDRVPKSVVSI